MSLAPSCGALLAELRRATEGLVFSSEGDEPFEVVHLDQAGQAGVPTPAEVARAFGEPAGELVEERDVGRLLARHIETSDPSDERAQALRPHYEALRALLTSRLTSARAVRVGRIRVRCYLVGLDAGGHIAGVRTVAIET